MSIVEELELKMYRAKEALSYAEHEYDCEFDNSVGPHDYVIYELGRMRKGLLDLEDKYERARDLYYNALDAEHRGETVDDTWVKNNEGKRIGAPI